MEVQTINLFIYTSKFQLLLVFLAPGGTYPLLIVGLGPLSVQKSQSTDNITLLN